MTPELMLGLGFNAALIAAVALAALVLALRNKLRTAIVRRRAAEASYKRLIDNTSGLRVERDAALKDATVLRAELVEAHNKEVRLLAELGASIQWNEELKAAQDEVRELIDGRPSPRPRRNQRADEADRDRNAWITRMKASWAGGTRVPPHEQPGGGDAR